MHLRIGRPKNPRRKKSRGQSLVEFTIMLPILLMMHSGLIEFGFLLNAYLDVIDAARDAARFAANDDPTVGNPAATPPPFNFYHRAWQGARGSLYTSSDARINWNTTNPTDCGGVNGDIVVSAFEILGTDVEHRWPLGYPTGASNCPGNGYVSKITEAQVEATLSGAAIPNSGFVVVEVYYEYEMLLGLPWITEFVPDPIVLYAYTIMPNTYVEPTPTP
jgi:hypothetical protein